jgi:hypothetical protein
VRLRLACGGPIGTTAAEETAILANSHKTEVLGWVGEGEAELPRGHGFGGTDRQRRRPAGHSGKHDAPIPDRTVVFFEIPADKRKIPVASLPSAGGLGSDASVVLTTMKLPVETEGVGAMQHKSLSLDAGPLLIGETCKTTVLAAANPEVDGLDLAQRWTVTAPK